MTIDSDPAFPQFLLNDDGNLVPLTAENQDRSQVRPEKRGFFPALKEFFTQLISYIKALFRSLPERLSTARS